MLNLKKQIRTLYINGLLGNLSLTGAWVVILAERGFSLVQIGFAETGYDEAFGTVLFRKIGKLFGVVN